MRSLKKRTDLYVAVGCIGVLAICFLLFAFSPMRNPLVYIAPDQRGVVISYLKSTGYHPKLLEPGLHLIVPFVEVVQVYSIAPQSFRMSEKSTEGDDSIIAVTKDGRNVNVSISVMYALNPNKIIELHIFWLDRYQDDLVRPVVRGTTRDIVLQYYSFEIGTKRTEVEHAISDQLSKILSENCLILVDFTVDDVRIP